VYLRVSVQFDGILALQQLWSCCSFNFNLHLYFFLALSSLSQDGILLFCNSFRRFIVSRNRWLYYWTIGDFNCPLDRLVQVIIFHLNSFIVFQASILPSVVLNYFVNTRPSSDLIIQREVLILLFNSGLQLNRFMCLGFVWFHRVFCFLNLESSVFKIGLS